MAGKRNSHCSYCGAAYAPDQPWPRHCTGCGETSYVNPLPVAVALLPVDGGLLAIRRAIPPRSGLLALPGGFVDLGESWQAALVRELREETGIDGSAAEVTLFDVLSAPDGTVLIFGVLPPRFSSDLPAPAATAETTGWEVIHDPTGMAFPLHTDVAGRYLAPSFSSTVS